MSGIPGSGKHSLCQELLKTPGGFGDGRSVHSLSGSLAIDGLGEGKLLVHRFTTIIMSLID